MPALPHIAKVWVCLLWTNTLLKMSLPSSTSDSQGTTTYTKVKSPLLVKHQRATFYLPVILSRYKIRCLLCCVGSKSLTKGTHVALLQLNDFRRFVLLSLMLHLLCSAFQSASAAIAVCQSWSCRTNVRMLIWPLLSTSTHHIKYAEQFSKMIIHYFERAQFDS